MFERRALNAKVHQLRLDGVQLRLGLGDVEVRRDSGGEPVLRQREILRVGRLRAREQLHFSVNAVKAEVVLRELGLEQQPGIPHVRRQRLGRRGARRHTAADASPQVRLPRNVERQRETGLSSMLPSCFRWSCVRLRQP